MFINLTIEDIQHLILKVKELCKSLKKSIDEQEKVVTKFKSDTLLTVKNFQDYGSSEHVSSINSTLVKSEKKQERSQINETKSN